MQAKYYSCSNLEKKITSKLESKPLRLRMSILQIFCLQGTCSIKIIKSPTLDDPVTLLPVFS